MVLNTAATEEPSNVNTVHVYFVKKITAHTIFRLKAQIRNSSSKRNDGFSWQTLRWCLAYSTVSHMGCSLKPVHQPLHFSPSSHICLAFLPPSLPQSVLVNRMVAAGRSPAPTHASQVSELPGQLCSLADTPSLPCRAQKAARAEATTGRDCWV